MAWLRSANDHWHRLCRLSWGERALVVKAAVVLPLAILAPRVLGFRRCQSLLGRMAKIDRIISRTFQRWTSREATNEDKFARAARTAVIVGATAAHGLPHSTCLQRSLTLWCLVRGQGIECNLRVGIHKASGQLGAHAWVEYLGLVLNDRDDVHRRYRAFARALVPKGATAQ